MSSGAIALGSKIAVRLTCRSSWLELAQGLWPADGDSFTPPAAYHSLQHYCGPRRARRRRARVAARHMLLRPARNGRSGRVRGRSGVG